jgi:hypothetical protein
MCVAKSTIQISKVSQNSKYAIQFCEGGIPPQLILGCRLYALLLSRSVNTQLALCVA